MAAAMVGTLQKVGSFLVLGLALAAGCGSDEVATPVEAGLRTLDQGLLLHWTFEDRVGTQILDVSGQGRHGALVGGETFVSTEGGEAVRLDGSDDRIAFVGPRDPSLYGGPNGSVTISARMRVRDAAEYNTLCFGCGPLRSLFVGTQSFGPRVQAAIRDGESGGLAWHQSSEALTDDAWVRATLIVEGGVGTRVYLDCALDTEVSDPEITLDDFGYSSVGEGALPHMWFDGDIDDFRIWDRALVDEELAALCPSTSPNEGLELHWTFEDRTATQVLDMSGNERHGFVQGNPTFVEGPVGDAVRFDGLDDFISFVGPRDPEIYGGTDGAFTVSARVRVDDVAKYNTLCYGCGPLRSMFVGTAPYGARVMAALDRPSGGFAWPWSTASVVENAWTEVTMVVEGGVGTRMYLGCALDSDNPDPDVGLRDFGYSSVGQGATAEHWFDGDVDELRVWSRALSDEDVAALCPDEPSVPLEQGLELHWSFEDRTGDSISDLSGNGRNGTMVGGTFVSSPMGEAASLDGVDDRIAFVGPRDPAIYGGPSGDYTMSARVRVWDLGRFNTLCFGCGPVGNLYLGRNDFTSPHDISNLIRASLSAGGSGYPLWPVSSPAMEEGIWAEVTVVVEGGVGAWIYVNGVLKGELLDPNVALSDPGFSSVGQNVFSDRWFGGEIDQLRIWSRALSEEDLGSFGAGLPFFHNGLMVDWVFEHHVGQLIVDRSGNGRYGRFYGTLVPSPDGEAAQFDGIDDYMEIGELRDPALFGGVDGSFTLSTQLRVTDTTDVNMLCFGCGPFNSLAIGNLGAPGRAWARLFDEVNPTFLWATTTPAIFDDTWVEITLTVDATTGARFYVDCELDSELLDPNIGLADYGYSSFGEGVGETWFDGEVDRFRVWDRVLTDAELSAICQ